MGVIQESLPLAAVYSSPQQLAVTIGSAVALGGTAFKAIETVHEGEMAVRMRRGRPIEKRRISDEEAETEGRYKIVGPNVYVMVPFVDKLVKINVRDNNEPIPDFPIETSDKKLLYGSAAITWHVRPDGDNPYKAIFAVNNEKDNKDKDKLFELKQSVAAICEKHIRQLLRGQESEHLLYGIDPKTVDRASREASYKELMEYGVALKAVHLMSIARTPGQLMKEALEAGDGRQVAGYMASSQISRGPNVSDLFPRDAS